MIIIGLGNIMLDSKMSICVDQAFIKKKQLHKYFGKFLSS